MTHSNTYTTSLIEDDDGELAIEFDLKALGLLGWHAGDQIRWIDNGDGSFTLKKVENGEQPVDSTPG